MPRRRVRPHDQRRAEARNVASSGIAPAASSSRITLPRHVRNAAAGSCVNAKLDASISPIVPGCRSRTCAATDCQKTSAGPASLAVVAPEGVGSGDRYLAPQIERVAGLVRAGAFSAPLRDLLPTCA